MTFGELVDYLQWNRAENPHAATWAMERRYRIIVDGESAVSIRGKGMKMTFHEFVDYAVDLLERQSAVADTPMDKEYGLYFYGYSTVRLSDCAYD
ncbi:hypothetical protein GCM10009733_020430 [Nonomuraea maheshkhaliensis]|uniref:Uncharacterized protein n=1 Tax=Nonomuraea maheshkhaliensis TaxID=419590 RepID=A0ABN2EZJ4_9ACTN